MRSVVAFARCVRSSHLVGFGFVEDCYYPNCVELVALPLIVATSQKRKHIWDDDYNKSLLMV